MFTPLLEDGADKNNILDILSRIIDILVFENEAA